MAAEPEKHKKRGKNFEWDIKLDVLEAVMACDSGHTKPGFAKVWQTLNNDSHLFGDITDEEGPSVIQNIWGNSTAAKSALFQGFKTKVFKPTGKATPEERRMQEEQWTTAQTNLENRRKQVLDAYKMYKAKEKIAVSDSPLSLEEAQEEVKKAEDEHHQALEERRQKSLALAEKDQETRTQLTAILADNVKQLEEAGKTYKAIAAVFTELLAFKKQQYLAAAAKELIQQAKSQEEVQPPARKRPRST